ncbi:MAG: hypothetical protein KC912_24675 [Proteobacteria bacterium]|nr:hypothetical protein [Pseudomonadota bacterium]
MRCIRCGEVVRSFAGLGKARGGDPDPGELLEAEDPTTVLGVESSASGRLYACSCTVFANHSDQPLRSTIVFLDASPSHWECAGHTTDVPATLEGVDTDDTDTAVSASLGGGGAWPWPHPQRETWPGLWVTRLSVVRPQLTDAVDAAVSAALDSVDPKTLRAALDDCFQRPESPASARLVSFFDADQLPRFEVTDPYEPRRDLRWALLRALDVRIVWAASGSPERELAARLALGGDKRRMYLLGRLEPAWVAENALELEAAGLSAKSLCVSVQGAESALVEVVRKLRTTRTLEVALASVPPAHVQAVKAGLGA